MLIINKVFLSFNKKYMESNQKERIIRKKIQNYIIQFAYSTKEIYDDTLILKDGYFDSMGFVMLISFLNETFGIMITDEELIEENFESIDSITKFVTLREK
jgi:acyl carrier protein